MKRERRFELIYAPQVKGQLQKIERKYHSLIRHTFESQLNFNPDLETKNRKPLKRPAESAGDWELRFGPDNRFRVYYAVERKHFRVLILAVGVKQRDRLTIGGEEVTL